jgi:hypothetical protein
MLESQPQVLPILFGSGVSFLGNHRGVVEERYGRLLRPLPFAEALTFFSARAMGRRIRCSEAETH